MKNRQGSTSSQTEVVVLDARIRLRRRRHCGQKGAAPHNTCLSEESNGNSLLLQSTNRTVKYLEGEVAIVRKLLLGKDEHHHAEFAVTIQPLEEELATITKWLQRKAQREAQTIRMEQIRAEMVKQQQVARNEQRQRKATRRKLELEVARLYERLQHHAGIVIQCWVRRFLVKTCLEQEREARTLNEETLQARLELLMKELATIREWLQRTPSKYRHAARKDQVREEVSILSERSKEESETMKHASIDFREHHDHVSDEHPQSLASSTFEQEEASSSISHDSSALPLSEHEPFLPVESMTHALLVSKHLESRLVSVRERLQHEAAVVIQHMARKSTCLLGKKPYEDDTETCVVKNSATTSQTSPSVTSHVSDDVSDSNEDIRLRFSMSNPVLCGRAR